MAEELLLGRYSLSRAVAGDSATRAKDSVAGHNDGDRIAPDCSANGPWSTPHPGLQPEFFVRQLRSKGNSRERCPYCLLERGPRPGQGQIKFRARTIKVFAQLRGSSVENLGIGGVGAVPRRGALPNSHSGDGLVARSNCQRAER